MGSVYRYLQDILHYDKPLNKKQVSLIQNLRAGQTVRKGVSVFLNKNGYPYEVILLTMKAKRNDIDRALIKLSGAEELAKTKYTMAIVSNSINDIYLRWKSAKQQKEKIQIMQSEIKEQTFTELEYQKTEKKTVHKELNDLW